MAGPLVFCLALGGFLLLVSNSFPKQKAIFQHSIPSNPPNPHP